MVKFVQVGLQYAGLLFFVIACASGARQERAEFQALFAKGNFTKAEIALEKSELAKDKRSRFLYLLEKGTLEHTLGFYQTSIQLLEEANTLADALYTKSISQKGATALANDNYEDYAGERYERSLLYFYLVTAEFFLYQEGIVRTRENPAGVALPEKDKKGYLSKARAHVLMWDSLLSTFQKETLGEQVFKSDLLQKLTGAMVHQAIGTTSDLQIALQLYKDAKLVLLKNFNAYPSFNLKAKEFQADYKKLPSLNEEELFKNYISSTESQNKLNRWLNQQILRLTKKLRPSELESVAKNLKVSSEVIQEIKNERGPLITFILQESVIDAKVPNKFNIGLKGAVEKAPDEGTKKAIMQFGTTVLANFASEKLGLNRVSSTLPQAVGGTVLAQVAVQEVAIEFELPKIEAKVMKDEYQLEIYAHNKKVSTVPIVLASNLSDVAEQALNEDAVSLYWKTGIRVASKHMMAILAAYKTYKLMGGDRGDMSADFMARVAAIAEYIGASKLIAASEKADTRGWVTAPFTIRFAQFHLTPGTYQLRLVNLTKSDERILGEFVISESDKEKLLTERHL